MLLLLPFRFHDFLNIDSEEAQMIKDTDKLYSKGSRLASEVSFILLCIIKFVHLREHIICILKY